MAKKTPKAPSIPLALPPLEPAYTKGFQRDVKLMEKRGKDMEALKGVIRDLCARVPLAARFRDHNLTGNWKGYRECHVEPDWLLIYQATSTELRLARTGSHTDLFR